MKVFDKYRYYFFSIAFFALTVFSAMEISAAGEKYKDGTYTGTGRGYDGDIVVSVVIESGKLKNVKIISQSESAPKKALEKIPRAVIEKQGVKGVDCVTGATYTSKGVINAVKNALSKATVK